MKISILIGTLLIPSSSGFSPITCRQPATKSNILSERANPLYSSEVNSEIDTVNGISSDKLINVKDNLLSNLLVKTSASDRGQYSTEIEKAEIENIVKQIEENSTGGSVNDPTFSSSIQGTWELLYSNTQLFRSSPFFMAGRGVCETEEQAKQYDWFCDMHRAALAISNIGKVRQIISASRMVSEFEVKVGSVPFLPDLTPFAYSGGLPVTIDGAIVSSADITSTVDGNGWEIYMDTVEIKGSNIPLLRAILDNGMKLQSRDLASFLEDNVSGYTTPRPIFKTTYLDDNLRISRDQDGKIFVYGKVSDDVTATDYSEVNPDLGLNRLWDGFKTSILSQ